MAIAEHLSSLREEFQDCRVAAYVDLSAKMVLSSSVRGKVPQEKLDALCNRASDALTGDASSAVPSLLTGETDAQLRSAVIAVGDTIEILQRSSVDSDEALCCVCDATVEITKFLSAGLVKLHSIGAET